MKKDNHLIFLTKTIFRPLSCTPKPRVLFAGMILCLGNNFFKLFQKQNSSKKPHPI